MKHSKVALYCRVSTDRQNNGLEAQRRALEDYCRTRGVENFQVFEDQNISGSRASRPALDRLMTAVEKGTISMVVVYSFSRFARSTRHLLDALDQFQRANVAFVSLTENVDTQSAIGKALFTIISAIAQLERELIAERVRNGLVNAKKKGKRLGRPKTRPSDLIRALIEKGHTYREISKLTGCSQGAIAAEIREMRCSEMGISEQSRLLA